MAFRVSALTEMGGFDVALGPGVRGMCADDTRAFTDLLYAGGTAIYQPTAVTNHFHRRTAEELQFQLYAYGVGLTAFYTSLVVNHPRCIPDLFRLLPMAYRDMFSKKSLRSGDLPTDFPSELRKANRRGMVKGPVLYLWARLDTARMARK